MKVKKQLRTAAEIDALYEAAKAIYGEIKALGRKTLMQCYALGEKLFELREGGKRTFARAVKEIGVGRSTAYEYINLYERAIERYGLEQLPNALSEFDSFEDAKNGLFPRRQEKTIEIGDPQDKNESSGHDSGNDATEGKAQDEPENVSDPKPLNKAAEFGRAKFDPPSFGTKVGHFSKWLAAEQQAIVDREEAVRALQTLIEEAQAIIDQLTVEPIVPDAGAGPNETQEASAC